MSERDAHGRWAVGNHAGQGRVRDSLVDVLGDALDDPSRGYDVRRALADVLISRALGGDMEALRYVYDRRVGKPHESVAIDATLENVVQLVPWVPRVVAERLDDGAVVQLEGPSGPSGPIESNAGAEAGAGADGRERAREGADGEGVGPRRGPGGGAA